MDTLINPADPPERQIEKLLTIASVLMRRIGIVVPAGTLAFT